MTVVMTVVLRITVVMIDGSSYDDSDDYDDGSDDYVDEGNDSDSYDSGSDDWNY